MVSELAANAWKVTMLQNELAELPSVQTSLHRRRNRGLSLSLPAGRPPRFSRSYTLFGTQTDGLASVASRREKRDFFRKYGPLGNSFEESPLESEETHKPAEKRVRVLDPTGRISYYWLSVVALAVSYFTWSVIFRVAFPDVRNWLLWSILDVFCYGVYVADLVAQSRTTYLQDGLLEEDVEKIFRYYAAKWEFKLDALALLPLDWLWMLCTVSMHAPAPLLFIRLLKYYRLHQFTERCENRSHFSHACRVLFMLHDLLVLIHWNACIYFLLSSWIGLGSDDWVYPSWNSTHGTEWGALSRQYVYSFYWSTMTLTTIGEVPSPETTLEYFFVIVDYSMGILMVATLVGNIGNIINNINRSRAKFQNKMSQIKNYMRKTNVPHQLQERVIKWFGYLWAYNTPVDEKQVLDLLPDKLKAEIGMHVHFETLKKVDFFAECEQGLLWELVLRLRTQVYSPGEYVCRKGDVGREMYIVSSGKLEVMSQEDGWILRTLVHGESFGEISVLDLGHNNRRRTAFVRSVGYSVLLCLNESELLEVLKDYPKTKNRMVAKGKELLGEDSNTGEVAQPKTPCTPQPQHAPLQREPSVLSTESSELDSEDSSPHVLIQLQASLSEHIKSTNAQLTQLEKLLNQVLLELQNVKSAA